MCGRFKKKCACNKLLGRCSCVVSISLALHSYFRVNKQRQEKASRQANQGAAKKQETRRHRRSALAATLLIQCAKFLGNGKMD